MKDVSIINIITFEGGLLESIESFIIPNGESNGKEEISKAEKAFTDKIKKVDNSFDDDDLESFVDDGYFDDGFGTEIRLSWSDKVQ